MENVLFKDAPSTKELRYRILQCRTLRDGAPSTKELRYRSLQCRTLRDVKRQRSERRNQKYFTRVITR